MCFFSKYDTWFPKTNYVSNRHIWFSWTDGNTDENHFQKEKPKNITRRNHNMISNLGVPC